MSLVARDRRGEAVLLAFGQVLGAGMQDVPDPVQRNILAAAVAVDVVLDSSAYLVEVVATWGTYQRMIAGYHEQDRGVGAT